MKMSGPPQLSSLRRRAGLVVHLFGCVFLINGQSLLTFALGPWFLREFGFSAGTFGLMLAAQSVSTALSSLISGPASDLLGRRIVIMSGCVLLSIFLMLHGLAQTAAQIVALRVLAGMSAGLVRGRLTAYLSDLWGSRPRMASQSWILAGHSLGGLAGVPIGLLLVEWQGVSVTFGLWGGGLALVTILLARALPDTAGADYVRFERIAQYRESAIAFYQRSESFRLLFLGFATFAASSIFITSVPLYLAEQLGFHSHNLAWLFAIGGALQLVALLGTGHLGSRIRPSLVVRLSLLGGAIGLFLTPLANGAVSAVFASTWVFFLCQGMRPGPIHLYLNDAAGALKGTQGSMFLTACEIGRAVGAGLAPLLVWEGGLSLPATVGGILFLLTIPSVGRMRSETRIG